MKSESRFSSLDLIVPVENDYNSLELDWLLDDCPNLVKDVYEQDNYQDYGETSTMAELKRKYSYTSETYPLPYMDEKVVDERITPNKKLKTEQNMTIPSSPMDSSQQSQVDKKEKAKTVKKGNHWLKMEEVILIGVVYDYLFLYGSLNTGAWKVILEKFKRCWEEYYRQNGEELVVNNRSECALLRHYKVMKQRSSNEMAQGLFKSYFRTWDRNFGHLFEN